MNEQGNSARQLMIEFVEAIDAYWQTHNQYEVQVEWLKEAYTCADALGLPLPQASLAQRIGRVLSIQSQLDEALEWMADAESHLAHHQEPDANAIRGLVHIHRASALYQRGKLKKAEEECLLGLDSVNETEHPKAVAEGKNLLGIISGRSGEHLKALPYLKESLALWTTLENEYQIARVRDNIGISHKHLGKMNQARHFYAKSLRYWKTYPDQSQLAITINNLGHVKYILAQCKAIAGKDAVADYRAAENNYQEALQISQRLGLPRLLAVVKINRAWLHIVREDWNEAESSLKQSLEIQQSQKIKVYLPETYRSQAEAAIGQEQYAQAITLAEKALDAATNQDDTVEKAAAHRVLGKAYRLSRKPTQAHKHLETSRDLLNKLRNPFETALTWQELANFYRMQGNLLQYKRTKDVVEKILAKMGIVKKESSSGQNS